MTSLDKIVVLDDGGKIISDTDYRGYLSVFILKANVFITALAANLFAPGIIAVFSHKIFATRGMMLFSDFPNLKALNADVLKKIPVAGELLINHSAYVYCSLSPGLYCIKRLLVFISVPANCIPAP
jgi:hypothetical protein